MTDQKECSADTAPLVRQVAKFEAIDGTLFDTQEEAIAHASIVDANKTVDAHEDWILRYLKRTPAVKTMRRARGEQARYKAFLLAFLTLGVTGDNIPDTVLEEEVEEKDEKSTEEQKELDVDAAPEKKKPAAKKPTAKSKAK